MTDTFIGPSNGKKSFPIDIHIGSVVYKMVNELQIQAREFNAGQDIGLGSNVLCQ